MTDDDPYARFNPAPAFTVSSASLRDDGRVKPDHFAVGAGGRDLSPELSWSNAPGATASFCVTVYDADAPTGSGLWHWAVANIPVGTTHLPAGAGSTGGGSLPEGSLVLANDMRDKGFHGVAPIQGTGTHRYYLVVHAVDVEQLDIDPETTPAVLGEALFFHTVGRGVVVGTAEYGDATSD